MVMDFGESIVGKIGFFIIKYEKLYYKLGIKRWCDFLRLEM